MNRAATIEGHAGEDVDHEGGDTPDRAAAVLDEVDRDEDADRDGHDGRDRRLDQGAVKSVVDSPADLLGRIPWLRSVHHAAVVIALKPLTRT